MAYGEKAGIGGWLVFFIITYAGGMLLSLAGTLYQLFFFGLGAAGLPGQSTYRVTLCTVLALQSAAVAMVIWRLIAGRNWRTIRLTILILWVSPFVGRVVAIVAVMQLFQLTTLQRPGMTISYFAAQALYSGVWTAYFLMSARVANTYRAQTADDLATTFA